MSSFPHMQHSATPHRHITCTCVHLLVLLCGSTHCVSLCGTAYHFVAAHTCPQIYIHFLPPHLLPLEHVDELELLLEGHQKLSALPLQPLVVCHQAIEVTFDQILTIPVLQCAWQARLSVDRISEQGVHGKPDSLSTGSVSKMCMASQTLSRQDQ
eukprot:185883-Pelagomonas_calceolata.AAC.1